MIGIFTANGQNLIGVFEDIVAVDKWVSTHTIDGNRLERLEASILKFDDKYPSVGKTDYRAVEAFYVDTIPLNAVHNAGLYRIYDKPAQWSCGCAGKHTCMVPRDMSDLPVRR